VPEKAVETGARRFRVAQIKQELIKIIYHSYTLSMKANSYQKRFINDIHQ
jgi:hypothetical protein